MSARATLGETCSFQVSTHQSVPVCPSDTCVRSTGLGSQCLDVSGGCEFADRHRWAAFRWLPRLQLLSSRGKGFNNFLEVDDAWHRLCEAGNRKRRRLKPARCIKSRDSSCAFHRDKTRSRLD
jgi:hypothetical protein